MQVKALSVLTNGPTTESAYSTSATVVVGLPEAPTGLTVVPAAPGHATVSWSAPVVNDVIGTKYTALVYKSDVAGSPVFLTVPLTATPGAAVSGSNPFSEDVVLPAGTYWMRIVTANSQGDGAPSDLPAASFTIGKRRVGRWVGVWLGG